MSIRHNRDLRYQKSRNGNITGAKTFKTEDAAKKYAEAKGIKKYTLKNLKYPEAKVKKIMIVVE